MSNREAVWFTDNEINSMFEFLDGKYQGNGNNINRQNTLPQFRAQFGLTTSVSNRVFDSWEDTFRGKGPSNRGRPQ